MKAMKHSLQYRIAMLLITFLLGLLAFPALSAAVTKEEGSVGLEGVVPGSAPTQAATITVPANGQTFSNIPITVSGLCPSNLLVKIFRNNVFSGSVKCVNGSYSLRIDLFNGKNDLVAKVSDDLEQEGPESNKVSVTFSDPQFAEFGSRVTITSAYAKRGANPGTVLNWPVTISGGKGPYAISVDWGDGGEPQLMSEPFAGSLNLTHTYKQAGVYNVIVKVTDANDGSAFLQLVAIANGEIKDTPTTSSTSDSSSQKRASSLFPWYLPVILILTMCLSFWLGKSYEIEALRRKAQ